MELLVPHTASQYMYLVIIIYKTKWLKYLTINNTSLKGSHVPIIWLSTKSMKFAIPHDIVWRRLFPGNVFRQDTLLLKMFCSSLSPEAAWNCDITDVGIHCWMLLHSATSIWQLMFLQTLVSILACDFHHG